MKSKKITLQDIADQAHVSKVRLVVILSLTWGLDDTLYICSISFPPPYFFLRLARTILRMDLMLWVSGLFAGQI